MNRFKRVFPLFLILAVSYTVMSYFHGMNPSAWDWLCNVTGISYFGVGGFTISWYLYTQLKGLIDLFDKKTAENLHAIQDDETPFFNY